jgi:hypothetical protein
MYSRLCYAEELRNKLETQIFLSNHGLEQNQKKDDDIYFQKYVPIKVSMSSISVHSEQQSSNDNSKVVNYFPSSVIDDSTSQRVDSNEKPSKNNESVSTVETKDSVATCKELEQSTVNEYE